MDSGAMGSLLRKTKPGMARRPSHQLDDFNRGEQSPGSSRNTMSASRDEELYIAKLLGESMPLSVSGSETDLDNFVSLRLLLLRPQDRRTNEENRVVDIIRKSHEGYSSGGRWNSEELASLVVKDWTYLRLTMEAPAEAWKLPKQQRQPPLLPLISPGTTKSPSGHQCHVLNMPNISTFAPTGAPTRMPFSLGGSNKGFGNRTSSLNSMGNV
jgi:hypothetical protein